MTKKIHCALYDCGKEIQVEDVYFHIKVRKRRHGVGNSSFRGINSFNICSKKCLRKYFGNENENSQERGN